ncbi:MAG: DUF4337 family protein [Bacteroidota bacterium]
MRSTFSIFTLLILFLISFAHPAEAVVRPNPNAAFDAIFGDTADEKMAEMSAKERKRFVKKRAKLKKKLDKLKKKTSKQRRGGDVWDNSKFRLGLLLILAAIAIALLSLLILGGFLGFIAGLVGLGGVIMLIWGLVEYSG